MPDFRFAAVLFDMDGVVIDDEDLHHQVWHQFAQSKGLNLTDEQVYFTHGRRAIEVIAAWFPDVKDDAGRKALLADREALYEGRLRTEPLRAVPGVHEYLAKLRAAGVPTALGTSGLASAADIITDRLKLAPLFDARITGDQVKHGKPAPEVWQTCASRLGVDVTRALVAEDAFSGVAAAKAAGAACLGITTSFTPQQLKEKGCDWTAPDFEHLPAELLP